MKKVKITYEITAKGYITHVEYAGKTYTEEKLRTDFGCEGTGPALDAQGLPDFICDNLTDPYEMMCEMGSKKVK